MKQFLFVKKARSRGGFSLPEVMLALAVFAFVMVSNFALFGLSLRTMKETTGRDEVIRSTSAIQDVLRKQSFSVVFNWVQGATPPTLFAYNYRGKLGAVRSDGTLDVYTASGGVNGKDYVVVPGLRLLGDPYLDGATGDLKAKEGALYRLFPEVSKGNPVLKDSMAGMAAKDYTKGVLAFYMKFYEVPNPTVIPNTAKAPSFACTMTYLR